MVMHIVLGGACSGKTRYAMTQAEALWQQDSGKRLRYLATAQAHDLEMRAKIADHQKERQNAPWQTDEEPLNVVDRFRSYGASDIVLFDSVGMWVSNLLLAEEPDIDTATKDVLEALWTCPAHCILVADEVGGGVVPSAKMGRTFRNLNGTFNQRLCAQASTVDMVIAGLVQRIKS